MKALRFSQLVLIAVVLTGMAGAIEAGGGGPPPPPPLKLGPTLTAFQIVDDDDNWWLFSGTVTGGQGTVTITFGNFTPVTGKTTTVNPDGTFSVPLFYSGGALGIISAQATDAAGNVSNILWDMLPP